MKRAAILALAALSVPAIPQAPDSKPVTFTELRTSLSRRAEALGRRLDVKIPDLGLPISGEPATRTALLEAFDRLDRALIPTRRATPRPFRVYESRLRIPAAQKAAAVRMVRTGLVAPVGPLVTGPGETLSLEQAGSAIGFFFAQAIHLHHRPTVEFSPGLQQP
ncbi:MAG: hypothetical protein MH204_06210 [Fimbriimonadaceae bacterium]|nr:hypothetical protein [Fimbriimonadaceae bacterium]